MSQSPYTPDGFSQPLGPPIATPAARRRLPVWAIVLIAIAALGLLLIVLLVGGLIYLGTASPNTSIYLGQQIPKAYTETFDDLALLEPGETVRYFYSDALLDIKQSMYLITDRHLILYSEAWEDPKAVIAFDQIVDVDASWSDHWIDDSYITVELADGEIWMFPLSMENDTDHRAVEAILQGAGLPPTTVTNP